MYFKTYDIKFSFAVPAKIGIRSAYKEERFNRQYVIIDITLLRTCTFMGVRYDWFKISSKIFICFFADISQLNILILKTLLD